MLLYLWFNKVTVWSARNKGFVNDYGPLPPTDSALQVSCAGDFNSFTFLKGSGLIMVDIIKVSAQSRSTAVAGAIAGVVREHKRAEVQAIGAGAVNQAVKAAAIARGYLTDDNIDVICIPFFTEVTIEDQERTALRLIVEPRITSAMK